MIYLKNVNKQYGPKVLMTDVQFHLRPNERVGLVGANGAGKSTLFRIMLGEEGVDAGTVTIRKNARVGMLRQELISGDEPILQRVVMGDGHYRKVREEMEHLSHGAESAECIKEWGEKYGDLQHEFERLGGYEREAKAEAILEGLGFRAHQMQQPLSKFSGGWRMRVELASLLLQNPEVLLLDEPTNHLDLYSVVWLESFLKTYDGAILLISHDRRFLNGLVTRIIELENGALTCYTGQYDDYERQKEERELLLEKAAAGQQRKIAEIERFIERFRAKNGKAAQAQSRVKMLEKMERIEVGSKARKMDFRFPQPARSGRIAIELENVHKSYGPVEVYRNFSVKLERGWKVALVGVNGAGKSTLMKLMAGVLPPDQGEVKVGINVTRAYYTQHHSEMLDPKLTVLESIEKISSHLMVTQQRSILGAFLFSGDDVKKKVGVLSGGERSRLSLARMLVVPASLLLLDEPTNHLDMSSCEVLSASLSDYEGSLCAISHDRYFLDGIINRVWEVSQGAIKEYVGNYTDYEWAKSRELEAQKQEQEEKADKVVEKKSGNRKEQKRLEAEERNRKYREQKPGEIKKIEARLEELLKEKKIIEQKLADPAIYQNQQKEQLSKVLAREKERKAEEEAILAQWEKLVT
jgi:ATP-binding cassette subfamily F protein 3